MQLIFRTGGALPLVACTVLALAAPGASAQAPLLDVVHTVGGADVPVPVEHPFSVNAAGTYHVVLTDLGSHLTPPAPLTAVQMAITSDSTIVGTPLTTPGTQTFNATGAGNYIIHVVATLTPPPRGSPPIGAVGIEVTDANNNLLETFSDTLAPPSTSVPNGAGQLSGSLYVETTGNYQVNLTDLMFPQALSTLTLAIVQPGQPQPVTILPGGPNPVPLQASTPPAPPIIYDIFAVGDSSASPKAGLYSVTVTPTAGGAAVFTRTIAVGAVGLIGSPGLKAQGYTLALTDLATPAPLAQLGALVALNGTRVQQVSGSNSQPFPGSVDTYDVFAFAEPGAGGTGSYALALQPASGPTPLSVARAVASAAGGSAQSFDADIKTAGTYAFDFADFAYPTALSSIDTFVVQSGAIVGKALTAPGSTNVSLAAAPASVLAFAQAGAVGGLFGLDLTTSGANSPAFAATQAIGQLFDDQRFSVVNDGNYQVTLRDLDFPLAFANLTVLVSRGATRIGTTYTAGAYTFAATPGTYDVSILAQPAQGSTFEAGTYAMTVGTAPPAPTLTLTPSGTNVISGTAVTLTWSTQNATACTASSTGEGGWSGSQKVNGSFTSPPLTTATTFTLSCSGAGGNTQQSVNVSITSSSSGGGGALDAWLLSILLGALLLRVTAVSTLRRARPPGTLAVLALSTLLAACGGPQSRFASYVERGNAHYAEGDYKHASLEFRNAMQINPRDPGVRLLAGHAAEKLGQIRQAAGLYQSAIDLDADNVAARGSLGRLFALAGAPQRALDTIQPGLAKHPDDPVLLMVRASARAQLKDTAGAVADVERALKLAPDNQDALALRAGLYQSAGDTASAIALLSSALQRHPESADLHETLANLYLRAGETRKAEEQLAALVRLKPQELRYRTELAIYLTGAHRIDDAQRTLEEAVRALPKSDEAKLVLVNFLVAQRDRAQGEQTLRRFIDQQPDNYALRIALGDVLWQGGTATEALAVYQEVIHRDGTGPSGLIARDRIADIYLTQRRPADAEKLLKEVLDKNPHDADALFMRAQLALERSDAITAVADLRSVLRVNPQSLTAQRLLARAYVAQGAFGLAEESLRAAMDLAPREIPLRLEYAQLLMRTGRSAQGIQVLEETVRANPQDSSARDALINASLTQRDYAAALAAARDLETLRPDYPAGPYLEGLALRGLGRTEEAQQALIRSLALKPGAIEPLTALAHLEVDQGHGAAAIERVRSAIKAAPSDPALMNLLGDIYIAQKDYPRAEQTLQGGIKAAPQWWPAYRTLALAQLGQHDTAGAIATYEAALKLAPTEPQLVIELGHLYVRSNRAEDAIKAYEALYQRSPQLQIAANNLALLLITYRHDRASLDRARDLTAGFASSDNGALLDTNGWVHVRREEYEAALSVLERAAERSPEDRGIRYHLAMAQMHLGQTERARTNLQAALAGSANYPWAADARAALARL